MHKQRQSIILLIMLFLVIVSAAHSVRAAEVKPAKPVMQPMTLMLEWFVNPNHGPIIIAQQKGYFEQEGLKIIIQEPSDPSLSAKLVAAGDVDIGVYYQPNLIQGVARGLPLLWAGTLISSPLDGVIVLDKSAITSLASLKGKTIGMSSNGNEFPKLDTLFQPYGFSSKDVNVINVGWSLSASLMSGQVDAIIGGYRNVELNVLTLHGNKGRMFYYEEYGVPAYNELIFIVNRKKHDKHVIRSFLRSIELGTLYIASHPHESWEIFKRYNPKHLDNALNRLVWIDTLPYFAKQPAKKDSDSYSRYARFLKHHGVIERELKSEDLMISFD